MRRRLGESSSTEEIPVLLDAYESVLRPVYLEQRRQVMPNADLVVDGLESVEVWLDQVRVAMPGGLP